MNGESKRWELLEEKYNGVVLSAFFAAPQLDSLPLTSCLPSPGCWFLGSLAPWLLFLPAVDISLTFLKIDN
jgi:hypothetical protein